MKTSQQYLTLAAVIPVVFGSAQVLAQSVAPLDAAAGAAYGIIGAALSRAEEAACRSLVNYSQVRGAFGEAVMDSVVLGSRRAGQWEKLSGSPKPQGFDGIYLRRDNYGRPRDLLIGEAKFGSGRLSMTREGRQLSASWTRLRLAVEASRYISAGSAPSIKSAHRPRGLTDKPDTVRVRLPDGRRAFFWRSTRSGPWFYDGPEGTLFAAQKAALRDGRYLLAAAEGRISYRQRVFTIDVSKDTISVKIRDARASPRGDVSIREIARIKIDAGKRPVYMSVAQQKIARRLLAKRLHLSQKDANMIVSSATRRMRHIQQVLRLDKRPYCASVAGDVIRASLAGGAFAGVVDIGLQAYSKGEVDWFEVGQHSLLGAVAGGIGLVAHDLVIASAINNAAVYQFFRTTANVLGLPTGMAAANVVGTGIGGVAGTAVYVLGMWLAGNMSDRDAARIFVAGASGFIAAAGVHAGVVALAMAYGTAGTGIAISSLSGAAANSAALAWLGGGPVAAGGGGIALGRALVCRLAFATAIGVAYAISWGYAKYEEAETNRQYELILDRILSSDSLLKELCRRRFARSQQSNEQ